MNPDLVLPLIEKARDLWSQAQDIHNLRSLIRAKRLDGNGGAADGLMTHFGITLSDINKKSIYAVYKGLCREQF